MEKPIGEIKENSGFCYKCRKNYAIEKGYDAELKGAKCPDCNGQLTLNHESLEDCKRKLHLSAKEIGDKLAILL